MQAVESPWKRTTHLGYILLRRGNLSQRQLDYAMARLAQRRLEGDSTVLGQVLIDLKLATPAEVEGALDEQRALLAPPCTASKIDAATAMLEAAAESARRSTARLHLVVRGMAERVTGASEDATPSMRHKLVGP